MTSGVGVVVDCPSAKASVALSLIVPFLTPKTVTSFGLDGVLTSAPGPSGSTSAMFVMIPAGVFWFTRTLNFNTPLLFATTVGITNVAVPEVKLYPSESAVPSFTAVPFTVAEPAT